MLKIQLVIIPQSLLVGTRGLWFCHYFGAARRWQEELPLGFGKLISVLVNKRALDQNTVFRLKGDAY